MKIITKFFGECEVAAADVIEFSHGIPGFENYHRFIITKYSQESSFLILQSVERGELAMVLIRLQQVMPGYSISLSDEDVADLKLKQPEDAALFAIVVIPADISKATVNLAAPVVIHENLHLGKQIIQDNTSYSSRHPLFAEVSAVASKAALR